MNTRDLLDIDKVKRIDELALAKVSSKNRLHGKRNFKKKRLAGKLQAGTISRIKGIKNDLGYSKPLKRLKKSKRKRKNRVPKTYKAYIESPFWEKRKNEYYQRNGRKCAVCGSSKHIQLHHMVYEDYGSEKDEHLVALCMEHHAQFHDEFGKTRRNMLKATHEFIIRKQEQEEAYELSKLL